MNTASMNAVKDNKVYRIREEQKKAYLAQGFDITDDKGNVIERSPKSTVSYAEYEKVKNQLEELQRGMGQQKEEPPEEVKGATSDKKEQTKNGKAKEKP